MADKTWKQFERRVATFFRTERNALSGGNSKLTRSDSLHPKLFIEAKQRKRFAAVRLWDVTKQLADRERKTPIVCLSEKGRPGFWIMVHSYDLPELAKVPGTQVSRPDPTETLATHPAPSANAMPSGCSAVNPTKTN